MIIFSISDSTKLEVKDGKKTYYGCDQNWYSTWWKRIAGCGPTTACTLLYYLDNVRTGKSSGSKSELISRMEDMWNYITPAIGGVNRTDIFYKGALSWAEAKNVNLRYEVLDIPEQKAGRPEFKAVLTFIQAALNSDAPVAFLNLCNGGEKNLDEWHWVTLISLECETDGSSAFIKIIDEGIIKNIDLALWYKTTKCGGGFVYFTL